jgi:hypothetical protein
LTGEEFDETTELAKSIRSQRLQRSRKALNQARLQLQKLAEMLPEGVEDEIGQNDLTLTQIDEALARMAERIEMLARD